MDSYVDERFAGSPTGELIPISRGNKLVIALSGAGVVFILLGLFVLALPAAQEGIHLWQLDSTHAIYQMDVAGAFVLSLGIMLTWLGSSFWKLQMRT